MRNKNQNGSAVVIVLIVIIVVLIGALGYLFWKNSTKDDTKKSGTTSSTQKITNDTKEDDTSTNVLAPVYHDFRTKGDTTGLQIKTVADVDKITDVGADLKAYFVANVGKSVETMDGKQPQVYTVDQVYGNYATGTQTNGGAYLIWGPKNGAGAITNVAGTQQGLFDCKDLKVAKVPSQLTSGKCYNFSSDGTSTTEKY